MLNMRGVSARVIGSLEIVDEWRTSATRSGSKKVCFIL
jgi:hypothetical protein